MKSIFRSIVVISTLLYVVYWFLPYIDYLWVSTEIYHVLDYNGYGKIFAVPIVIEWVLLFSWLLSVVGLYFFYKPARTAFVILTIIGLVLTPLSGVSVLPKVDATLSSIIGLCDGALLAMAYLTSLAKEFECNT